jgi:CheY-like chemotaxis protein
VFIRGDRERMAEALTHLVEHAIHQCELGGAVQISISASGGTLAEVTIQDDGVGMEAEQLEHLFDAFHRSGVPAEDRHRGATLGLPIVGKVVQLHGGRIESTSKLGGGTRFKVILPAFAAAVGPMTETAAARSGEILLVEDDQDCREVLIELLEQEGYTVMSAPTVDEALTHLQGCRPAMVLLDLRLAQEDGRGVLHHIRGTQALEDVIVYLISGASEVASLSTGTGLDRIDGFFEKPLQLGKLLDTVAAVVRPTRAVQR